MSNCSLSGVSNVGTPFEDLGNGPFCRWSLTFLADLSFDLPRISSILSIFFWAFAPRILAPVADLNCLISGNVGWSRFEPDASAVRVAKFLSLSGLSFAYSSDIISPCLLTGCEPSFSSSNAGSGVALVTSHATPAVSEGDVVLEGDDLCM